MKNIKSISVFLAIISFIIFSGFSSNKDFNIDTPEGFSYCYGNEDTEAVAENLGMSEKELEDFFKEKNIEYLAVSEDKKAQIRISVYKDGFSKKAEDISVLSDKKLAELGESLTEGTDLIYDIYLRNGRKYIEISETLKDNGGEFTATQFITVANKKIYNITFYNDGKSIDENYLSVLDSFEVNAPDKSKISVLWFVLVVFGIAVFSVLAGFMIFKIIKDVKNTDT